MGLIGMLAVFIAYVIKGMCGFANTLVFGSIMSFSANTVNITPVELLIGYPSNLTIAIKERKSIQPKVCIPLAVLVIAGCIPGAYLLKNGDVRIIKLVFGLIIILLGIEMLLRAHSVKKHKSSKLFLLVVGIASGVLCGIFGIGALLAAYISRTTTNTKEFRGNICVVFFAENTFRIILYSLTGIITGAVLKNALLLLPFMVVGLGTGFLLARVVKESIVKHMVILLLIASGISLFLSNLL